ncbi:MAG TPA: GNAT family N-acetyltransferase [Gemmatimonadaceae bacterium]|nr:GNAT family N-acetyltransferase [Gemmatimonadaceae bacterium]
MTNETGLSESIRTERLTLRRPRATDAEAVFRYASDPDVTDHMDWARHTDISQSRAFLEYCDDEWVAGREATWAITLGESDQMVGVISVRPAGHKAAFGYALSREFWGRGIATEAARAVIAEAFRLHGIIRVWATCAVDNVRSRRVLEKAGLEREGIIRAWCARPQRGGAIEDSCFYSVIRR